jgi:hypothetical protein
MSLLPSKTLVFVLIIAAIFPAKAGDAPSAQIKLGVYYFDGWSGGTDAYHLKERLQGEFSTREPLWGWHDNTPEIMRQQIDLAANAGISFWSFCWYWPEAAIKETPANHALSLYLKAPNRNRLGFCLMVANHAGYRIGPSDWPAVTAEWIKLFQEPGYVTVDGKPLLIIYSPMTLIQSFGGASQVKAALDQFRREARAAGLSGVTVAGCCLPGPENGWDDLSQITAAGFDVLTGYAYVGANRQGTDKRQHFSDLMTGYRQIWDLFAEKSSLPYMPVIASGWDKRAWEPKDTSATDMAVYYPDRTPQAVQDFVESAIQWTLSHPHKTPQERIILLYAWNEYGEGGYLTPTKSDGNSYLDAVHRALSK